MRENVAKAGGTIELKMVAQPRPGLSTKDLVKIMEDLGNPIVDESNEGLTLLRQIEPWEMYQGQLVWQCDNCGAAHPDKDIVEEHERNCNG